MAPDAGIGALKLRAEDADDLVVLSACLQDALVPVRDLAYMPDDQLFVFVANRFRWERGVRPALGEQGRERVLCAVAFAAVLGASYRGFRRTDENRILALLTIRIGRPRATGAAVHLDFSGDAAIRLEVARIRCRAKDLGEPWPTPWHPRHDEEQSR
ncbi:MAG TPA: DUF2948 family protein [Stellaceae bacterium]|jgi:hypothetical protein